MLHTLIRGKFVLIRKNEEGERNCQCTQKTHDCQLIVVTGGPGAGKTAVLESVRKIVCSHVAILPESAGIVFGGGFWRLDSLSGRVAAQKAIYYVQREMENLIKSEQKWGIGLCDRGSLDGLAYWPESEDSFFHTFGSNKIDEYTKYKGVIHLQSPSLEKGYNHQNPIRIESADEAAKIDEKIHGTWRDHPNYTMIESTDSFLEKVSKAFQKIESYLPDCCKEHFKKT